MFCNQQKLNLFHLNQIKSPEQTLLEDLYPFLNAQENKEIINKMIILDHISKLLKRDGIDNIIDIIIHSDKLDIQSIKKIIQSNQNKIIDSQSIRTKIQNAFDAIQQRINHQGDLKRATEDQKNQFMVKFKPQHNNNCAIQATSICFHQNDIKYFCDKCKQEHEECQTQNKIEVKDILNTVQNQLTQSYNIDGIDITCSINPQLTAKLKQQSLDYMTIRQDFQPREFLIDFFEINKQMEIFAQFKKSINESIELHKQKSAFLKINKNQNDQCQHNDSRKICLRAECLRVNIFCSNCANFHQDHEYLNEIEIRNIDIQQLQNMESLDQTFKFMDIMKEVLNQQQVINDQFLIELAKKLIYNMTGEDIKKININKFNNLQARQAQIRDWKTVFRERARCIRHPQLSLQGICLQPECNYELLCDDCQNNHEQHATYQYTEIKKALYEDEFNKFVQLQKQTIELEELMTKTYFPNHYLDKLTQKQLTSQQFQEEVRQALIRSHKNQLKINRDNQTLNDYLKSYLQAYFSSYLFQENLQQGLDLVNQLDETPQMDNQLNQQQKQYFNEIVDITRLHKYTISFYKNMQLIFKQIYSQNFIKQDQYNLLIKLTKCNNLNEKNLVIQEYSKIRDKIMITQGQSLLFRDIQQLVSKFERYLGQDIIYILNHKDTQETIQCKENYVCQLLLCRPQKQPEITEINYFTQPGLDFIKLDFQKPQIIEANEKISIIINFYDNLEFYSSDICDQTIYENYFKIIANQQEVIQIDRFTHKSQFINRGIISAIILRKI
ncbi:hypothetical protein pb186bvf_006424 [Paramecium bursaria]